MSYTVTSGTSLLNDRKFRLSVYMTTLLCVAVPTSTKYGVWVDTGICDADHDLARACNVLAAGYFMLLACIIICGFFMWVVQNTTDIVNNKPFQMIMGIVMLVSGILIFIGVLLTYDDHLLGIGFEWFVISHVLLLAIDLMMDYASQTYKRLLSYSLMYFIGCCILIDPFFEADTDNTSLSVTRSGLILVLIGCVFTAILGALVVIGKKDIDAQQDTAKWFFKIIGLFLIVGVILMNHTFIGSFGWLGGSVSIRWLWIIVIGVIIHGFDVAST